MRASIAVTRLIWLRSSSLLNEAATTPSRVVKSFGLGECELTGVGYRHGGRTLGRSTMGGMAFDPVEHWQRVYGEKAPDAVSWYQRSPERSLSLILAHRTADPCRVVDIGAGASVLVDHQIGRANV